jgi:hypothetical protein
MKHFALVGLVAALFSAPLGAQSDLLFNVTVNPDTKSVTLTATPNVNIVLPVDFTQNLTIVSGLTLTNIAQTSFETFGGFTIEQNSLTASQSLDQTTSNAQLTANASSGQMGGRATLVDGLAGELFKNDGLNLDLFHTDGDAFTFSRGATITFSGSIVFSYQTAFTAASFVTAEDTNLGPQRVYAGVNNAYGGASFLGTYQLTVVPEPSTYAAIAGGLGLAAAVIHRRRQRAKAAQA